MPTVARFDGLRVVVYPNDHRPAHVHVIGGGCEAVFDLGCPDGPIAIREVFGFARADVRRIVGRLATILDVLCSAWGAIHEAD